MNKIITGLFHKYKEIVLYFLFGTITTLINIISFKLFYNLFSFQLLLSNTLAWILAFIFAFITNKVFVFESKEWRSKKAIKEMMEFLTARLFTLVLDSIMMWILVDCIVANDLFSKILSNIITIVINYLASKFFIFRKEKI